MVHHRLVEKQPQRQDRSPLVVSRLLLSDLDDRLPRVHNIRIVDLTRMLGIFWFTGDRYVDCDIDGPKTSIDVIISLSPGISSFEQSSLCKDE